MQSLGEEIFTRLPLVMRTVGCNLIPAITLAGASVESRDVEEEGVNFPPEELIETRIPVTYISCLLHPMLCRRDSSTTGLELGTSGPVVPWDLPLAVSGAMQLTKCPGVVWTDSSEPRGGRNALECVINSLEAAPSACEPLYGLRSSTSVTQPKGIS